MNINEKSTKDEIISTSMELVDIQSTKIENLQQQQIVLFSTIGALAIYAVF